MYDTKGGFGPWETYAGNNHEFTPMVTRYVRYWSAGNSKNDGVHMVEMDVMGPGNPVHRIPENVCTKLQYKGSCADSHLKGCPSRRDGTCSFNVYGHRTVDEGNTCSKACAKVGLKCVIGFEGASNCHCNHIRTSRQQFGCHIDLSTQEHYRHKAHFWCKCGGPVGKPSEPKPALIRVADAQCKALAYEGSCENGIKGCPRSDGSCGINVYGHRNLDNRNTCTKACASVGLKCHAAIEGTNNCHCKFMDTVRQDFSCDTNLAEQSHKVSKAHYWCKCAGPYTKPPPAIVAVPPKTCKALKYEGSCTNGLTGCSWKDGSCGFNVYGYRASDRGNTCRKACATVGLQCVAGMEGRNNCHCSHMDTVKQEFSCDQKLTEQKHITSKSHFWCTNSG